VCMCMKINWMNIRNCVKRMQHHSGLQTHGLVTGRIGGGGKYDFVPPLRRGWRRYY
jgi:hypothetical protein